MLFYEICDHKGWTPGYTSDAMEENLSVQFAGALDVFNGRPKMLTDILAFMVTDFYIAIVEIPQMLVLYGHKSSIDDMRDTQIPQMIFICSILHIPLKP